MKPRILKYNKSMTRLISINKNNNELCLSSPSKISLRSNCAFNLPAGEKFACPGATEACEECYAKKNRHVWPNVQTPMAKNFALMKKLQKKKSISESANIMAYSIPKNTEIFRIHESGDFYNQWYIDMWAEAMSLRKEVKFWAYTRSFHLNFTPTTRLPNFNLWASADKFNLKEAKRFVRKHRKSGVKLAYGPWDHDEDIPKNSFICPVTSGKLDLPGACEKCMLCVGKKVTKKNIVFLAH